MAKQEYEFEFDSDFDFDDDYDNIPSWKKKKPIDDEPSDLPSLVDFADFDDCHSAYPPKNAPKEKQPDQTDEATKADQKPSGPKFVPHIISYRSPARKKGYFRAYLPEGGTRYSVTIVSGRSLASVFTKEYELWNARDQIAKDSPHLTVSIEPLNPETYVPPPVPLKIPKPANLRPLDLD